MSRRKSSENIEIIETKFQETEDEESNIVRAPIAEEEDDISQETGPKSNDCAVLEVDAPSPGGVSDNSDTCLVKHENGKPTHAEDEDEIPVFKEENQTQEVVTNIHNFFSRERDAFIEEKSKKLRQVPKVDSQICFDKLIKEWKNEPRDEVEPERHWSYQWMKREGEKFPAGMATLLTGLFFTLLPNCAIGLDYITASEYIGGNWYLKDVKRDFNSTGFNSTTCRRVKDQVSCYNEILRDDSNCGNPEDKVECLEYDPVYGTLTLVLTFSSGIFWSGILFYRLWIYLTITEKSKEFWDRKRMFFFFYTPLAVLSILTFPVQLIGISIISLFNDTNQWILLTTRIGIAEGLYNAHFQFVLQLFVFFVRADRHPSTFQYLTAFGSLAFLSYSRVESLTLDRGGHRMSPGQKAWWIIRYAPSFLVNCAFKLGSLSLICALLRFNCIWLYGFIIIFWLLLQILFNEQVLPRRWYYLFLGAGMHAVTVAHIPEEIKLIDTDIDIRKNILWSTRLTGKQIQRNLRFQNGVWFVFNYVVIISMWIFSSTSDHSNTEIQVFWPFTPGTTYSLNDNKVFRVLNYVAPIILVSEALPDVEERKDNLIELALDPGALTLIIHMLVPGSDSLLVFPAFINLWRMIHHLGSVQSIRCLCLC